MDAKDFDKALDEYRKEMKIPKKLVDEMTIEEFDELPHIFYGQLDFITKIGIGSLVIIPTDEDHDSGFKCMKFCITDLHQYPIGIMGGVSDVIHIDGVGGYGQFDNVIPDKIPPKGWRIDCLPCGYLRLFARTALHIPSTDIYSDFDIYAGE